jgi:hypothetical protein
MTLPAAVLVPLQSPLASAGALKRGWNAFIKIESARLNCSE